MMLCDTCQTKLPVGVVHQCDSCYAASQAGLTDAETLDARHAALDARIDALPDSTAIAVATAEGARGLATTCASAARDYLKAQHPDDTERALLATQALPAVGAIVTARMETLDRDVAQTLIAKLDRGLMRPIEAKRFAASHYGVQLPGRTRDQHDNDLTDIVKAALCRFHGTERITTDGRTYLVPVQPLNLECVA